MDAADESIVFFNPHVFEMKKMEKLEKEDIVKNFGAQVLAIDSTEELTEKISAFKSNVSGGNGVLLLMSSGNFNNAVLW